MRYKSRSECVLVLKLLKLDGKEPKLQKQYRRQDGLSREKGVHVYRNGSGWVDKCLFRLIEFLRLKQLAWKDPPEIGGGGSS